MDGCRGRAAPAATKEGYRECNEYSIMPMICLLADAYRLCVPFNVCASLKTVHGLNCYARASRLSADLPAWRGAPILAVASPGSQGLRLRYQCLGIVVVSSFFYSIALSLCRLPRLVMSSHSSSRGLLRVAQVSHG
jgi:hypothetical protein